MDLGLGNLAEVKAHVLAAGLQSGTDYDAALTAVARGVAARFDRFCNRSFARAASGVEIFDGDRLSLIASRYPIESVSKLEQQDDAASAWYEIVWTDAVVRFDSKAGLIYLNAVQGDRGSQLRLTYTGGYFFETKEPTDQNYPTTLPTGATLLPADLKLAWLTQIAHVWESGDRLGTSLVAEPGKKSALKELKLLPLVSDTLADYARYA